MPVIRPWCTSAQVLAHPRCPDEASDETVASAVKFASAVLYRRTGSRFVGLRESVGFRPGRLDADGTYSFPPAYRPVVSVQRVVIDGAEIDSDLYTVENSSRLRPVSTLWFPRWQNLGLILGQPGTWSIDFTWGAGPGPDGEMAAIEFAVSIIRTRQGSEGVFDDKVTKVVREGVELTVTSLVELFREGSTGIGLVDQFIAAVGSRTRTNVINPDKVR